MTQCKHSFFNLWKVLLSVLLEHSYRIGDRRLIYRVSAWKHVQIIAIRNGVYYMLSITITIAIYYYLLEGTCNSM